MKGPQTIHDGGNQDGYKLTFHLGNRQVNSFGPQNINNTPPRTQNSKLQNQSKTSQNENSVFKKSPTQKFITRTFAASTS